VVARHSHETLRLTFAIGALVASGSASLWVALWLAQGHPPSAPSALLLGGVTAATLVAVVAAPVARLHLGWRARRMAAVAGRASFLLQQLSAGVIVAALLMLFEYLLQRTVDPTTVDVRHFSLHPWIASRLALLAGILACQITTLWAATLIL